MKSVKLLSQQSREERTHEEVWLPKAVQSHPTVQSEGLPEGMSEADWIKRKSESEQVGPPSYSTTPKRLFRCSKSQDV